MLIFRELSTGTKTEHSEPNFSVSYEVVAECSSYTSFFKSKENELKDSLKKELEKAGLDVKLKYLGCGYVLIQDTQLWTITGKLTASQDKKAIQEKIEKMIESHKEISLTSLAERKPAKTTIDEHGHEGSFCTHKDAFFLGL